MTLPLPIDLLTALGPDTVELVIREPYTDDNQGVIELDEWGQPVSALDESGRPRLVERTVTKSNVSWIVTTGTEEIAGTVVAVLNATGVLPVDDDTQALNSTAAVRHNGRLFELTTPGVRHLDGLGRPSHVRVYAKWAEDVSLGERVVIIPAGGRVDGVVQPDGDPIPVIARAVAVGRGQLSSTTNTPNPSVKFGPTGPSGSVDYTVVLDLDAPISDGDWLVVRGHECRASVGVQESQWADRRELVVLAEFRGGGRS